LSSTRIYGKNPVRETLRGCNGEHGTLYITRENKKQETVRIRELAEKKGIRIKEITRKELDKRLPNVNHQGLLLEINKMKAARIDSDWRNFLPNKIEKGQRPRVAILDQVQDPNNLGAILRSAALFNFDYVFIPAKNAAQLSPAARKTACGGDQYVAVITVSNLARLMEELQQMGFWIGAACMDGETKLWDLKPDRPFAVILGSEGSGVRRLIQEKSDYRISIPGNGKLDSLNVSVAAALIFHEIYKFDNK